PNHHRHVDTDCFRRLDRAGCDDVAAHDAAEDIDQNSLDRLVCKKNPECILHLFGIGAAADIEEVGGTASRQFDNVHSSHGETRTIHHASNAAVELDIVQTKLTGFDFERLFFVEIAEFLQIFVAIKCVVIEVHLSVESVTLVVTGDEKRIDLR